MKYKTRFGKAVYITVLAMLLMAVFVYAAVPSQTFLSDTTSYFKGFVGFNKDNPTVAVDVTGDIIASGTIDSATLNTGQGDNELYDMDQNVLTTSDVEFQSTLIDQNGNAVSLNIDSEATSTGSYGLKVSTQGSIAGILYQDFGGANTNYVYFGRNDVGVEPSNLFFRNLGSASTGGAVVKIIQDNGGDDKPAQEIRNDGTGNSLFVDQNGNGVGLNIDSEATSVAPIEWDNQAAKNAGYIGRSGDVGVASNLFSRNADATATNVPVMLIRQDHAGDDQDALSIQNDGTGASIGLTENGAGIEMKSPDGTTYCLTIANGGTTNVAAGACSK